MSLPPGTRSRPRGKRGAGPREGRRAATGILPIIAALEREYGRPRLGPRKDPLSELVFTILSQNTSDTNRDRAWASLWRRFDSWEAVAGAPRRSVESAIRSGGLAPTKSRVIQETLRSIHAEQGGYTLESLRGASMETVESYLMRLKGVGLKTIRCVQVFSLGQPAFPVDTHILRLSRRLGLVPAKTSPERAHAILQALVPPSEVLPFHINLITHGRRVCKAARPLCDGCVLRLGCPSAAPSSR